jgi:hypothetical protein
MTDQPISAHDTDWGDPGMWLDQAVTVTLLLTPHPLARLTAAFTQDEG